ncbi:hypothetical protein M8818_006438 [Zalaria obscura]|uniref:Uncharacterized protein n=1 Tax=Zalaria obscura TaxID=2024903 RepID=A0ACC3S7M7_9PEZI
MAARASACRRDASSMIHTTAEVQENDCSAVSEILETNTGVGAFASSYRTATALQARADKEGQVVTPLVKS